MTIEERREAEKEVERILDNIKDTEDYIKEYKDMLYNDRDEIDVIGCAKWLLQLQEQLKAQQEELEDYLYNIN
ncbi:hypothetical protein [Bacillus phage Hakuna]|uniref:Uncharacterized protein n=2 Tax=Wphvirus TaxID=1922327 RepID=A0A024B2P3_9CAUD|nr:hypothetical protein FP72_gp235 [Bacillus phage Hakuna]YP_009281041.1 hypothetical protein SAGEFAYGE_238 [Bacillus phage SageFayge]AHZ10253.1 hypothetical protein [Bacillus phage Hakuna]AMW63158.1 hypothetical protein SAGEFAYGE_238 [Bacillus phage SageFayge]